VRLRKIHIPDGHLYPDTVYIDLLKPDLQRKYQTRPETMWKRSGIGLLAGRVMLRQMHPFLLSELGEYTDLTRALDFGLSLLICFADDPADTLNAYLSLFIREEVQYEGLVRNIGNFSRFLEAISFSHASILNINNVAREAGVERKVIEVKHTLPSLWRFFKWISS
jgi:hypothetical protein